MDKDLQARDETVRRAVLGDVDMALANADEFSQAAEGDSTP